MVARTQPKRLAQHLLRRLVGVYAVSAIGALLIGGIFFLTGLDMTSAQMKIIFGLLTPLASIPMLILDVKGIRTQARPISDFLNALPEDGEVGGAEREPLRRLAGPALVRALNLPLLTALRVMLVHMPAFGVPAMLLVLLANKYFWLGVQRWQLGILSVTIVVFSAAHAIYEYFGVAAAVRPIIPMIRRHAGALPQDDAARIVRLDTRRKLLALSAFVVCVPLAALGATVLLKLSRIEERSALPLAEQEPSMPLYIWVVVFVAIASLIAVAMLALLAREIASLTGELGRAMRRVEQGELGTALDVTSTDEFADLYEGFNRMTRGLLERERLRDAFGRYVAPEIAEQVLHGDLRVGGDTVRASVLFADIRGFTDLSGRMPPADVVAVLNRYIAAMDPAIRKERGWINKFGGDSILAVFGAPVAEPDHARLAARAALGMRAALDDFNEQEAQLSGERIRIGIGVHCGEMVAGNVGSPERMEYTVIGDVVNVASRIQGLNKELGTEILISAAIREAIGDRFTTRDMPPSRVQGKSEPLVVYALEGELA